MEIGRMGDTVPLKRTALSVLAGGGETGALIRAHNWTSTPLGAPETWPQSLRTAVGIMLSSRYAMFVWWGHELVNLYNDAYRPFLGKKHPNALGQSAREVWAEIWDLIGPRTDSVLRRGESTFDEALLLLMERFGYREETYFTFSYSPIRDDQGGIGGLFCAVTDETRRVIGDRRLRLLGEVAARSSARHTPEQVCASASACFTANAHDLPFALVYLTESDGRSVRLAGEAGIDANAYGIERLADLQEEVSRWPFAEAAAARKAILVEDLSARFARLPSGAWDRPPERAVVVPLGEQGQSATTGFLVAGLNPYLSFDQEYRGFIGLLADQITAGIATARARAEERARAEALAELDRAKTVFFSNVSHEFRTPLTLMLGPLNDALEARGAALPPRVREQLEIACRNGLRLLKLVNTLLDFSRIEAGRVEASFELTDVARLTAELAAVFRAATEKAGLRLTVECEPVAAPVYLDREMWEKIVLNLVSNAFKYTLQGEIEVRLRHEGRMVALSVRDTGSGIPESELPHVFERFYRVKGTRGRTDEGSGIGLALVQELVRFHGGTMSVESVHGQGSVFTVRIPTGRDHLPLERVNAPRDLASTALGAAPYVEEALRWLPGEAAAPAIETIIEPAQAPDRASTTATRPTILLVDDNADMRQYLRRLLSAQYEVVAASDGARALALIRQERPDLVLTDVMMPGLDGFGLLRAIRADATLNDLPVMVLSARAGEEASAEGLDAGADDYLTKPFAARELMARVRANLQMARLRRGRREAEEALRQINEWLEERVSARTAALRESESRFRILVEGVVDYAIFMLDREGFITNWNPGAERIKGYRGSEIIGRHFSVFYTEEDRANRTPERALATAAATGKFEAEGWRVRKDGSRFWAMVVMRAIRDESGSLIGFAKVTRDMTERRVAEDRMRQAQKMEAIGQLTGGVAHDFNNLLTVIFGNLESLQRHLPADRSELHRFAEAAARGASRAARLTQQLLAFSRRQPLEPKPLNLNRLVTAASEMLRRTLGERIAIETALGAELWWVQADASELENALLNLAVNARDAMPEGGTLTIETANVFLDEEQPNGAGENARGQHVMIAVSDTGTGMPPEVAARAFEPFFTTKPQGQGTGLGLSQVYGFIKQSGGQVKISSEPGQGTSVRLYFPRLATGQAHDESAAASTPIPTARPGETILVVEDDDDVRAHSVEILRELGYRVTSARDGASALCRLAAGRDIRLLFTDIGLPGELNGRELAEEARRRHPALRVLFTTAYVRDAVLHQGKLGTGVELVAKPFTYAALAAKIRAALDQPATAPIG
jgi:PAS domain S-box-containing protein